MKLTGFVKEIILHYIKILNKKIASKIFSKAYLTTVCGEKKSVLYYFNLFYNVRI
jgi:hypothetical protein